MAKINLLTIHWGESYGAILQTYATCEILKKLGHEVILINLLDKYFINRYKRIKTYYPWNLIKILKFYRFKKKYFAPLTKKMTKINLKYIPQADCFIVGSDQVWNRDITKDLSLSFFFDFVSIETNKIALSSSFSKSFWREDNEYTLKVKNELQKFKAISVREQSGVKICNDVFNVKSVHLVDPTIALGDFDRFIKNFKKHNDISCFMFIQNELFFDVLKFVKTKINKDCRYLAYYSRLIKEKKISCNSPDVLLKNIAGSSFVITDSFHGLVFSILFKKQFIVLRAIEDRFERLNSLLQMLQLEYRIILSLDDLIINENLIFNPIDYNKVDVVLKEKQIDFYDFIEKNIR